MNRSFCLLLLVSVFSCTSKTPQETTKPDTTYATPLTQRESFDDFFERFKTDTVFQKLRQPDSLNYTAISESEDIEGNEDIVTSERIAKTKLFFDNASWEGKVLFKKDATRGDSTIKTLTVEDTGILMEFYFVNKKNRWVLVKIVDAST